LAGQGFSVVATVSVAPRFAGDTGSSRGEPAATEQTAGVVAVPCVKAPITRSDSALLSLLSEANQFVLHGCVGEQFSSPMCVERHKIE
jgi:hypothetical protein